MFTCEPGPFYFLVGETKKWMSGAFVNADGNRVEILAFIKAHMVPPIWVNAWGGEMKDWIKDRASGLFVVGCLVAGLIMVYLGGKYLDKSPDKAVWIMLSSLGGSIFAFSLTLLFFSISDTKRFFERTLANVISKPDIVVKFGEGVRKDITKASLLGSCVDAIYIHDELAEFLFSRGVHYLSGPISEGYHYSANIRRSDCGRGVTNHYTLSYRMVVSHLKRERRRIPFRYEFDYVSVMGAEDVGDDWISCFSLRVGNNEFGRDDLVVKTSVEGNKVRKTALFEREITVDDDCDVFFESEAFGSFDENIDICKVKYPARGMRADLTYEDGLVYDAIIFRPQLVSDSLNCDFVTHRRNNITIYTNSWVMPGDGVVISFNKPGGLARERPIAVSEGQEGTR